MCFKQLKHGGFFPSPWSISHGLFNNDYLEQLCLLLSLAHSLFSHCTKHIIHFHLFTFPASSFFCCPSTTCPTRLILVHREREMAERNKRSPSPTTGSYQISILTLYVTVPPLFSNPLCFPQSSILILKSQCGNCNIPQNPCIRLSWISKRWGQDRENSETEEIGLLGSWGCLLCSQP